MASVAEFPPSLQQLKLDASSGITNTDSDKRGANRAHKRRQRQRNCEHKQREFDYMLSKIPVDALLKKLESVGIDVGSVTRRESDLLDVRNILPDLYTPIPEFVDKYCHATADPDDCFTSEHEFWMRIPPLCTPDESELNEVIADETLLKKEEVRQMKYKKKLIRKLQDGDITNQEMEEMLVKHGRSSSSSCNCGGYHDDDGITNGSLMSADRGKRKRCQVENFAMLLSLHDEHISTSRNKPLAEQCTSDTSPVFRIKKTLRKIRRVVDFGCGSGNLCLALAACWPEVEFVFVDKNQTSLELLKNRGRAAGLTNIEVMQCSMDAHNLYDLVDDSNTDNGVSGVPVIGNFDVGIGLHCCGSFSDAVVELCRYVGAGCLLCPCCNGKMSADTAREQNSLKGSIDGFSSKADGRVRHPYYVYPRSAFFQDIFTENEFLDHISRCADDGDNYAAKCLVELDRALWARTCTSGFKHTSIGKLFPETCTPKHHIIWMLP